MNNDEEYFNNKYDEPEEEKKEGSIVGTRDYVSPEIIRN